MLDLDCALLAGDALQGICLDLQKAFDRIPRDLVYKLMEAFGLPEEFVCTFESYYPPRRASRPLPTVSWVRIS